MCLSWDNPFPSPRYSRSEVYTWCEILSLRSERPPRISLSSEIATVGKKETDSGIREWAWDITKLTRIMSRNGWKYSVLDKCCWTSVGTPVTNSWRFAQDVLAWCFRFGPVFVFESKGDAKHLHGLSNTKHYYPNSKKRLLYTRKPTNTTELYSNNLSCTFRRLRLSWGSRAASWSRPRERGLPRNKRIR